MNEKLKQLIDEAQAKLSEAASLCEGEGYEEEDEMEGEEDSQEAPIQDPKANKAALIIALKSKKK